MAEILNSNVCPSADQPLWEGDSEDSHQTTQVHSRQTSTPPKDEAEDLSSIGISGTTDVQDIKEFYPAIDSLMNYEKYIYTGYIRPRLDAFDALPKHYHERIENVEISQAFESAERATLVNADFAKKIAEAAVSKFFPDWESNADHDKQGQAIPPWEGSATAQDVLAARAMVDQFYREWTDEGASERKGCYEPIIQDLYEEFLMDGEEKGVWFLQFLKEDENERARLRWSGESMSGHPWQVQRINVLVPGSGLSRLVFDLARDLHTTTISRQIAMDGLVGETRQDETYDLYGQVTVAPFCAVGIERSTHCILGTEYLWGEGRENKEDRICPFALNFSDLHNRDDQSVSMMVPDQSPGQFCGMRENSNPYSRTQTYSMPRARMHHGNFVERYHPSKPEKANLFDAIATAFFIDTATNVLEYIDAAKHCLKPGGIWCNLGPLQWTFAESKIFYYRDRAASAASGNHPEIDQGAVELSGDEVLALITQSGFELVKNEPPYGSDSTARQAPETTYQNDVRSMSQGFFRPMHWVMRKLPKVDAPRSDVAEASRASSEGDSHKDDDDWPPQVRLDADEIEEITRGRARTRVYAPTAPSSGVKT